MPEVQTSPGCRVLLIEDSPTDALLVEEALRDDGFPPISLDTVRRLGDALQRLSEKRFDAALLDLGLPDSQGLQTVERLRQSAPELPLVVLTGTNDIQLTTQILARGAQDYVLKQEVVGHRLSKTIYFAIERHRVTVELERHRRELLARERRIQEQAALIDAANDAILATDLSGSVRLWNKSAERIHGWEAGEVLGKCVGDFLYSDASRFREIWTAVRTRGDWMGELSLRTRNGPELLTATRLTLIHDVQGCPRTILSIATDITDRKKLESRILRAQRLEGIGALAGGIAHDLNNVLAPITMSASLLREKVADEDGLQLVEAVASSAQRGADMVRQILTFARGVDGRRTPVDPRQLILELARIFNDTFFKSIRIHTDIAADVAPVLGDPTQIHQVLLNLGVNARDAMPAGGELRFSAGNVVLDTHQLLVSPDARAGAYVVFTVTDTGTGMSPDVLERLFEPFFTTKEVGKGTGLGLATVQGIVRSHGGFITVYSELDHGSTFKVYLPAHSTGDSAPPLILTAPSIPRGHSELILVVDDESAIRQITKYTLEAFGYRTLVARDGTQALALYAQHSQEVALVLTDMMMPALDGASTIRALKEMNPAVKTIAASGLGNGAQAHAAASAGCDHFLHKPYTAEALLEAIHAVLHETRRSR